MDSIKIFIRGLLMGVCDLIPGISGGTIAFITGIYIRLINAVHNVLAYLGGDLIKYLTLRKKTTFEGLKDDMRGLDVPFLAILLLGILTSILLGSKLIKFLLDYYFAYTISFFVGLILASSKIIFDRIEKHDLRNMTFGVLGFALGFATVFIPEVSAEPTLPYVFLGGFLAISAMFLPGISGAFVLLVLGLYGFMIGALNDMGGRFIYILAFVAGAMAGAAVISKLIVFLFKKDRCKTLYFLLGLVLGALSTPIKNIFGKTSVWTFEQAAIMVALAIVGILAVLLISRKGNRKGS
ncbi:MAG: DUF368 domain-containing protein [Candidatus Altiarchaeota archaeon]|nr:DUF368 domain-containing protein [Candidatus Altiarchaeota archaeon]